MIGRVPGVFPGGPVGHLIIIFLSSLRQWLNNNIEVAGLERSWEAGVWYELVAAYGTMGRGLLRLYLFRRKKEQRIQKTTSPCSAMFPLPC